MVPIGNGVSATNGNTLTAGRVTNQPYPQTPQTPVSFTPDQINAINAQTHAFISRGMSVPEPIQQAIRVPNQATPTCNPSSTTIKREEIEAVDPEKLPKGALLEEDRDPELISAIWAMKMRRLLVPSFMPDGVDPHQTPEERNAYIDARIEQRM
ncbi:hypothetical protein BD309DRAFT_878334 [Dichomitus squalens]|uniref:QLQ domain-containing protein n=2 Tax=Dichomitus squalens TaxID=114155 RepID=A0A4Q9NBJ9_9APHY|nr:uncharacterized protein DICSQDRAFT_175573 [Dichomitus squalens LYAD-421 SS1]TBU21167.1 hypothetical protein BD311DRAFT_812593 [Dichomitus squalens]EJF55745.1 hypothetical protein DICSQDRAFT_175573 [Dichomitus squalens LYAD-421 SS1]TBU36466.1 hypothetical protein BD309DRAFT_878334 [Dichomitus squalens]TBU51074.1 hypothetical protein BD310DRAFT_835405 [Dichomitus squalens]TBU51212.1 hypothetical protein BD310DRAFT_982811 [Dichomitus squalens]